MCTNPKIHDIYKFEHLDVQLITDDKYNLGNLNYQLCLNNKKKIQKQQNLIQFSKLQYTKIDEIDESRLHEFVNIKGVIISMDEKK